jgi:hypothetical protein
MRLTPSRFPILALAGVCALALMACDSGSTRDSAPSAEIEEPTPPVLSVSASPSIVATSTGWLGQELTLDAGDTTLRVTAESTSLSYLDPVALPRSFSVFITIKNTGDEPYHGAPGSSAVIVDEFDARFEVDPSPEADMLHPDPERYGYSNLNLAAPVTIPPGGSVQGVIVFHTTGGYREITINLPIPGGDTGAWVTNYSV